MNRKRVGGIAAGMFAVGLLTGLAGTAVARDGTPAANCAAVMADHMTGQDMTGMASMMGGSMMGGSMMGGSMMSGSMGPGMMGPDAPGMPWSQHELHHPSTTPGVTK
jgi:hypothetical protein